MNINDSSEIKMNWTFALAVSVVIHVVVIGLVMLCSDSSGEAEEAATQEEMSARSSDSGETENAEPASDSAQTPPAPPSSRVNPVTPTSVPPARRSPPPRPSARASTTPTSSSESGTPATPATASTAPATDARSSASRPAASSSVTKTIVYEVKPGDNLTKIAKKHKCTVTEIAKLNKMKPNKVLWVGLKLKIPAPVE
ncbi:MAG: LysM peptidoglycan-binding domain-containing protein [Kiritimatiellae bacterium]|nr:LysM peptidoglycan-binding domain-containing protein [Kiritimatiellia bacterium]